MEKVYKSDSDINPTQLQIIRLGPIPNLIQKGGQGSGNLGQDFTKNFPLWTQRLIVSLPLVFAS